MAIEKTSILFAFDKQTETLEQAINIKYIVKSYHKGNIIYFEENNTSDGFGSLIQELQKNKSAVLYLPKNRTLPILEFLTELRYSVVNARLTLTYKDKNTWKTVNYLF